METFSDIPHDPSELDAYLAERESSYDLKPDTEAQIVWSSESKNEKTKYSIVYLHGFRASHPEGEPVHRKIAGNFGYNLFLSRMDEHGIEAEYPLLDLTEKKLLRSARFAFEVGRRIGNQVILMGTSTGGSLALWLASQDTLKHYISSLILYSPLIRFYGINQKLLTNTITRILMRFFPGKKYLIKTKDTTYAEDRIWNKSYALQGALALGSFIDNYMQEKLFSKIECPVFAGYYFKNKKEQDQVVSVSAIKEMAARLGTRTKFVNCVNFPAAKNHVICSELLSKSVPKVVESTKLFLKNVGSHTSIKK